NRVPDITTSILVVGGPAEEQGPGVLAGVQRVDFAGVGPAGQLQAEYIPLPAGVMAGRGRDVDSRPGPGRRSGHDELVGDVVVLHVSDMRVVIVDVRLPEKRTQRHPVAAQRGSGL